MEIGAKRETTSSEARSEAAKRRKVENQLQLSGNSTAAPAISDQQRLSAGSDHNLPSCSSSNGSSNEKLNSVDLEEEMKVEIESSTDVFGCRERRETTPLRAESGDMESYADKSPEMIRRRPSTAVKMPTAAEIEKFFAAAEKKIQKQFKQKYNYDIAKDAPLEGRYEWVELKP